MEKYQVLYDSSAAAIAVKPACSCFNGNVLSSHDGVRNAF